jgi:hypothetical protein
MTDSVDGSPAGEEDETAVWLSVPGLPESLAEADADYAAGRTYGEDIVRARYGLTPRAWRRWDDVAALFAASTDPIWVVDRDEIAYDLRDPWTRR